MAAGDDGGTRRLHRGLERLVGRVGLAAHRFRVRATALAPRRTWTGVVGVGLAIAMLLIVSGLALGIAGPGIGLDDGQTYWIVPESADGGSLLVTSSDARFGLAHDSNEIIRGIDGVTYSTPLLIEILPVAVDDGPDEYVAFVGVVPADDGTVLGLSTAGLSPETSYYADGSYDGPWTGDAVASGGAAALLGTGPGDDLNLSSMASERGFTVRQVDESGSSGVVGSLPIVLVHLAELQELTGATALDHADRFVVQTESGTPRSALTGVYGRSEVMTSSELAVQQVVDSDVGLALAVTAVVVALVVGVLFVGTTMTLEMTTSRRQLWTLHAIGIGRTARFLMVGVETTLIAVLGSLLGSGLGYGGIALINAGLRTFLEGSVTIVWRPIFVGYAVVVGLVVVALTAPVLAVVTVVMERDRGDRRG